MIKIENCDINLDDTITCGQLFRYFKKNDNSYDIILKDRVINVKLDNNILLISSNDETNLESIIYEYFDLNTNYNEIGNKIIALDNKLKESVNNSKGLKMLRQDPLEMIISYIISANNKVERISKSINMLCSRYGKKINFNNSEYYLFPDITVLNNLTIEQLNDLKIGFRDKYVYDAIKKIYNNEIDINEIYKLNSTDALNYLMKINGVGPKVASCILLFGYNRFDVFPIDTWVIKEISNLHPEIKSEQKYIIEFAKNKYKDLSAVAIQYMFHNSRNKN